jgi:hypothetical protein
MHHRRVTAVVVVSAAVVAGAGCRGSVKETGSGPSGTLLHLKSAPMGIGANGARIAWVYPRVVVADLDSGRKTAVAAGSGNPPVPVAVSGSTVLWLDDEGGNEHVETIWAAAPGRLPKRLAHWTVDNVDLPSLGYQFGGIAGKGRRLAYALYLLSPVSREPGACSGNSKPCRARIAGGGTFLVEPGSLSVRRVLPPARAVAVDGARVAAAVFKPGALYSGRAQVVVEDLADGSVRKIGRPASVQALTLAGEHVAALIGANPPRLRVWSLSTGAPLTTLPFPRSCPLVYGAVAHLALTADSAVFWCDRKIVAADLRTGRRRVVARGWLDFGPWVWGRRVVWAVVHRTGTPAASSSLVRSAPLPPAS